MPDERKEAIRAFLKDAGWADAKLTPLPGDASTRRYMRAASAAGRAMLMDQPQQAEQPPCPADASIEERHRLGYNAVARLAGADCARFVAVAEYLGARGLSAPQLYAADVTKGLVLMEDLGDRLYADVLAAGGDETMLYENAVDALAQLHTKSPPATLAGGEPLYAYDETALLAEVALMTEWFFPVGLSRTATDAEILEHAALWREVLGPALSAPPVFVHRDYHAQNLLWLPERRGPARVGMIDFQDAVAGARSYDLVSLLEDARRDVAPELGDAMTRRYFQTMRSWRMTIDADALRREMAVMAAQRNAKIVGIFARLFKRD